MCPRNVVVRLDVAREDSVPKLDLPQVRAKCRVAPDDADIGDVQMIVRAPVHCALAVVLSIRNDHPVELVCILRVDHVLDVFIGDEERSLLDLALARLVLERARECDIGRQGVAVPKGYEQQQCAADERVRIELSNHASRLARLAIGGRYLLRKCVDNRIQGRARPHRAPGKCRIRSIVAAELDGLALHFRELGDDLGLVLRELLRERREPGA